jgi:dihydroxyacetone kinase
MSAAADPMARWQAEMAATQADLDAVEGEIREVEATLASQREQAAARALSEQELAGMVQAKVAADARLEFLRLRRDRVAGEVSAKREQRAEAQAAQRRAKAGRVLDEAAQAAATFDELLPKVALAYTTMARLGAELRQIGLMDAAATRTAQGWMVSSAADFRSEALRPLVETCMAQHDPNWRSDYVRANAPTMTRYLEERRAALIEQVGVVVLPHAEPSTEDDPPPARAASVNGSTREA